MFETLHQQKCNNFTIGLQMFETDDIPVVLI